MFIKFQKLFLDLCSCFFTSLKLIYFLGLLEKNVSLWIQFHKIRIIFLMICLVRELALISNIQYCVYSIITDDVFPFYFILLVIYGINHPFSFAFYVDSKFCL